jgi:hypothetical protein
MDSGQTLFISLFLILVVAIIIQLGLYRNRKKQRLEYPKHWEEFETCKKHNEYDDLIIVGNKLIYNKFLSQVHLEIIHSTAVSLEDEFPEFKSLRLNAYNKQLHYRRTLPQSGSSGGIKQSWSERK